MKLRIKKEKLFPLLNGRKNMLFLDDLPDIIEIDDVDIKDGEIKRTDQQNRSLHLLFSQIADACNEKGIAFYQLVKDPMEIPCTPENIKMLWKRLQEFMFGKKSTTELKKTGEIDELYAKFSKIISDKTKGEVLIPPFPHNKDKVKEERELRQSIEYPTEESNLTPKF
jgi:hypothetical protein